MLLFMMSVRGDRRIEPAIPARLRKTALVLDVVHVLAAEFLHRRNHRADRCVAEGAERLAADVIGHVQQQIGIFTTSLAALDAVEDRLQPVRPLAARRALTAGL